ncbi:hypothetical protein POM88_047769 [Heracleum sosnowskyi]|uniref:F-box domain-containing protein n=1 Tax=Heracleum sosnowskyi TaxID=360622 RepID=A0AAD8LZX6_9APIA|nr:hypothetical protein POM88_047769 [Heracleum sosnowskyi]
MAKKIEMCSCYVPDEIIFQLLLLLPVQSLVRFKSVCKSWRSIISDPQFIETHTKQNSSLENTLLVVERDNKKFIENLYLINTPTSTQELVTQTKVCLPPQFGGKIRFVDHCNGLVCLSDKWLDVIFLWNPSTKQYKILPKKPKRETLIPMCLGFGFDSISNDYKVLSFSLLPVSQDGLDRYVPKAEMYSANADSWVEIEVPPTFKTSYIFYSESFHIKIGGVIYLELDGLDDILWFDLHNEASGVHMFPNSQTTHRKSNIFDFRGSVAAIFTSTGNGGESVYSIWALLDDGCGKVSWTKKFNLAPDLDFNKTWVDCFLGSGHFVTLNGVDECIFYDYLEKKEIKVRLQVAKAVEKQQTSTFKRVVKYTETLVSLQGFEQLK